MNNDKLLDLFLQIGLLKKILRTGWVLKGVKDPESVAEHIFRLAILSMLLAKELKVDQLKLIKMALVHDLGEAIIGDIKWEEGTRIVASQEDKHRDEKKAIEKMFSGDPNYSEYVDLWIEFNDQNTKEARALKLLDKLEMVIQAYEYKKEGYTDLEEFWQNAEKYLKGSQLEELFVKLLKKAK